MNRNLDRENEDIWRTKDALRREGKRLNPRHKLYEPLPPFKQVGEEAVSAVLKGRAQATVRAGAYYDKVTNGLNMPWFGKVWLNAPYSRGLMAKFAGRLLHQYELGNVEAGIMLVHNCTETSWFQISGAGATRVCFPKGRIGFYNPARTAKSTPGIGQALLYYGPGPNRFDEVFGAIGLVMGRPSL